MKTSSHGIFWHYASCQGRKSITDPIQLFHNIGPANDLYLCWCSSDTLVLGVIISYLIGLKACSTGENSLWYYEHSQVHIAGEAVNLKEKPTSVASLDQCNLLVYSKCISLYLETSVPSTTRQRNFFLQLMEMITKFHSCSNAQNKRPLGPETEVTHPQCKLCT